MGHNNKRVIGFSAFVAIVGVGLIVSGIASDHWVNSNLHGNKTSNRSLYAIIEFGLFSGSTHYDVSIGPRQSKLEINCDMTESVCSYIKPTGKKEFRDQVNQYKNGTGDVETYGLFGLALFVTNLVMLCLSIVFGLVLIGFSFFNVFGRPIETITGITGLHVWNALALIFTVISITVYLGLFFSHLYDMMPHMHFLVPEVALWENDTRLDWSFYCIVGSAAVYLINVVILVLSKEKCTCNYRRSAEKEMDNGMILY